MYDFPLALAASDTIRALRFRFLKWSSAKSQTLVSRKIDTPADSSVRFNDLESTQIQG